MNAPAKTTVTGAVWRNKIVKDGAQASLPADHRHPCRSARKRARMHANRRPDVGAPFRRTWLHSSAR